MDPGFDAVYGRYGRAIHAYVARLTGDPGTAEDVCQETFLRYLAHERDLAGRNGHLGPWLFRVATNLGIDRLRRARPTGLAADPAQDDASAGDALQRREAGDRIRAEVGRLEPDLRAPFLLRAHHGLTFPQIGEVLDVPERTAKDRYRRARDLLLERLGRLLGEEDR